MSTTTEQDELFKAIAEFVQPEPIPVHYYLYYNNEGDPLYFSCDELEGNKIEITKQQHEELRLSDVKIINGELKIRSLVPPLRKLVPSDHGTTTHKNDITIVTAEGRQWALKGNDEWK